MIVVNGKIESTPDNIAAVKDAIASMESASRAEDGCIDYTFSVELSNPGTIRITEKWSNAAALRVHFATKHMKVFQEVMAQYPPASSEVHFYDAKEADLRA